MPLLRTFRRIQLAFWFSACFGVLNQSSAFAVDVGQPLAELHHTAFTSQVGAPSNISAIAQSRDGYLWLGSASGLYRFDGVKFSRPELMKDAPGLDFDVSALLAQSSGDLWIGSRFGGIYRLRGNQVTAYGVAEGVPKHTIGEFAVDSDGVVWAATASGLYRFNGSRWNHVVNANGVDGIGEHLQSVAVDRAGTVWASSARGVFYRAKNGGDFMPGRAAAPPAHVLIDRHGEPWLTDQSGVLALTGAPRKFDASSLGSGATAKRQLTLLSFDREGAAWGVIGDRFVRVKDSDAWLSGASGSQMADRLADEERLSGAIPKKVFEDREGNIWLGTNGGLDRFRANKFEQDTLSGQALPEAALACTKDGSLWIGTDAQGLVLQRDKPVRTGVLDGDGTKYGVFSLYADAEDVLWIGGRSALWQSKGGVYSAVALPFSDATPSVVQAITSDGVGTLWISVVGRGVYKLRAGQWLSGSSSTGLPEGTALSLHTDREGRVWLGYPDNRVAIVSRGEVKLLGRASGLRSGNILAMTDSGNDVWVGGSSGVSLFSGGHFYPLLARGGKQIEGVSGIVQTSSGELWLNGTQGVTRISAASVNAFVARPEHTVDVETFNAEDGLQGVAAPLHPLPSAAQTSDGRIRFATTSGVFSIDPARIHRNSIAPTAFMRTVQAGDRVYPGADVVRLPEGTADIEVDYTSPALSMPERTKFAYRLLPLQREWQDASDRRQAFFTNLEPGEYVFEVRAANEDGLWSNAATRSTVIIAPAFWQTWWFALLSAVIALAAAWLGYVVRMRVVARRIASRFEDLARERERIARDLHDTLLQGTQGLVMHFQGIACNMAKGDAHRTRMESVLDQADTVMAEARSCVAWLRSEDSAPTDLFSALIEMGRERARDQATEFVFKSIGPPQILKPVAEEELYRIGREALLNAFKHAQASVVTLVIEFSVDGLSISVGDNGVGFEDKIRIAGKREGHWGLVGLRERTARIGAVLKIETQSGEGSTIRIAVPAKRAYLFPASRESARTLVINKLSWIKGSWRLKRWHRKN